MKPKVRIRFCMRCNWMLRSAWYAQELLSTFGDELEEVALAPGSNGEFSIAIGDHVLWSRADDGGFPPIKELKQRLRDVIDPTRDLGHVDR